MAKYTVGINVETTIEADSDSDAISMFLETLSWKDCYLKEEEEDGDESEG